MVSARFKDGAFRLMLAADTKADMDQWTSTLNKGIENANLWN